MQDHQIINMQNAKLKIIQLLQGVNGFDILKEDIKDESFELNTFEQPKEEFLTTLKIYFANNNQRGEVVVGLKEMIENVKQSNTEVVITNSIQKAEKAITIYTDSTYSEILGII